MRTKHLSFQLEETIPGTFLAQGWLAGILIAFVLTVVFCLATVQTEPIEVLVVLAYFSFLGTIIGVFKSILMWMPYRVLGIQVRAVTRVAIASSLTGLLSWALGRMDSHVSRDDLIRWVLVWLMCGLPTAILVGSSIKPWDLFTYGSIAGQRRRSVLGTLGTLPLRFLSLLTLAAATLYFARQVHTEIPSLKLTLVFCGLASFLLFSAYLTFRSPQKWILCAAALIANLPVVAIGYWAFVKHLEWYGTNPIAFYISALCASFVTAWAIFLVARLTVPISKNGIPLNILSNIALTQVDAGDHHHCLGSRFVEWQERVA
jgi:hypothetical protein